MTRDERQLIRMMNRSFSDKKNSRNIEIKDLSKETDSSASKSESDETDDKGPFKPYNTDFNFNFDLDDTSYDVGIPIPDDAKPCEPNPESNEKPEMVSLTENDMQNIVKECVDRIWEKIKNNVSKDDSDSDTVYALDVDDHLDTGLEIDEISDDVDYKPLIQHFTLTNPWLPYEKDLDLNMFRINQDNTVELEFDIRFNKPLHLKYEPTDLHDPLKILNRFKALMDKSNADDNNIICTITYNNAPDNAKIKSTTVYNVAGRITSMAILQFSGLGLRINVKGKIANYA